MSKIWLKEFGGMVPRIGEQHLSIEKKIQETGYFPGRPQNSDKEIMVWPHATEAENCHLLSGELRPLKQPQLTHTFCRPDEGCWRSPLPGDPSIPPDDPPEPPACIPVVIESQSPASHYLGDKPLGDIVTLTATVNSDATAPLQYQWYKNGIALPGETNSVYQFTAALDDAHATYQVYVTNPCGSDSSETWLMGDIEDI